MGKRVLGWFGGLIAFFLVVGVAMTPLEEDGAVASTESIAEPAAAYVYAQAEQPNMPNVLTTPEQTVLLGASDLQNSQSVDEALFESAEVKLEAEESVAAEQADYVLNTNSGKFHYPDCPSVDLMNESNKAFYAGPREGAIEQGYVPCLNCNP